MLASFSRGLRAKNLHDSASRKSADAEGAIDQNVPSRNNIDIDNLLIAEAHDRAFAVVFCDLLDRQVEVLVSCCSDFVFAGFLLGFRRHIKMTVSYDALRRFAKQKRFGTNQKAANIPSTLTFQSSSGYESHREPTE